MGLLKPLLVVIIPTNIRKHAKQTLIKMASSNKRKKASGLKGIQFIEGINLVGYARAEMGIGESCRLAANSMNTVGLPFGILNFEGTNSARMSDLTWIHKEVSSPSFSVNVFHVNAEQMAEINAFYGDFLFNNRYNVGYWHWELPEFPNEWNDSFSLVDEIWVASTFVAESISIKSPVPVVKIPHAIEVKITEPRDRTYFKLPEEAFLFLTMFDFNSYQERKNPRASIEAFKLAFEPDNMDVGLVVKVNGHKNNLEELESLIKLTSNYENIYIIQETLSRNDVNALISVTNCFISLHRSEGFGLVMAEAMYLGKPVIGTNWSSNTDFMNVSNSCPVEYELISLGQDYGPYKSGQYWAEPNVRHASEYMTKLVNDREYYNRISSAGELFIKSNYSPRVIGELIKKRLNYIHMWKFGG